MGPVRVGFSLVEWGVPLVREILYSDVLLEPSMVLGFFSSKIYLKIKNFWVNDGFLLYKSKRFRMKHNWVLVVRRCNLIREYEGINPCLTFLL